MQDCTRFLSLLEPPVSLEGKVVRGKRLGREIGFPTANIALPEFLEVSYGIYASRVSVGDESYIAVTNVGTRPTVEGDAAANAESYLVGFRGDLYGEIIRVVLYAKLREETRFCSVDELADAISGDVRDAVRYFENSGIEDSDK